MSDPTLLVTKKFNFTKKTLLHLIYHLKVGQILICSDETIKTRLTQKRLLAATFTRFNFFFIKLIGKQELPTRNLPDRPIKKL